jgi:hypothetical protein
MSTQSNVAFNTQELARLKASNLLKDFVRKQEGAWNHAGWENLLSSVRQLGYGLPAEVIGSELEVEKVFFWKVKNGEIQVPEPSAQTVAFANAVSGMHPSCTESVIMCDMPAKAPPTDLSAKEPRSPEMPKRREPLEGIMDVTSITSVASAPVIIASAGPIEELENAVIVEGRARKGSREDNAHPWDSVDFESLSREEKAAYMKSQLKDKIW